jgi:thermostable 8-oxoguanine DNA glycosylase
MPIPDKGLLIKKLSALVEDGTLIILPSDEAWRSGVYSVLDTVFSARARYHAVVVPMLRRLNDKRPNLSDKPDLTFSTFVADVDSLGSDRFEEYSRKALNRQKLSGRLKTEVAYDISRFFMNHSLETKADLQGLGEQRLSSLVLRNLRSEVHGIGPRLSYFLLMRLGQTDLVKVDVMVERFFGRLSDWKPSGADEKNTTQVHQIVQAVAERHNITAMQIDSAIWRYESGTELPPA